MNALDYVVVALYMGGLLFFGYLLRNQSSEGDYFLGGRSMGWFPLTLSTMATQLSAISFVSAPAFVGLREGGGLKWLTYEFSLPLAMILVMFVIAPALYRAGVVSIYEYLEQRFGRSTRILISVSFQIVRSFATGIMVYAMGLILEAVIGIPLWQSLFVVGIITLIYSTSGGMKAVVYGDAIQMVLIFGGLLVVTMYALADIGGLGVFWREVDPGRLVAVDFNSLGLNGDEFGFIPMLFGGFVLYASYYGCDQTQAQRIISAKDLKDTKSAAVCERRASVSTRSTVLLRGSDRRRCNRERPWACGKDSGRQARLHDADLHHRALAARCHRPVTRRDHGRRDVFVEFRGQLAGGRDNGRPLGSRLQAVGQG